MKKSKWILNLTLSIVTVMLAAEVLAKGGKNPSVRAGNGGVMHGSTVYGFNPSMRAAMRYQITLDRMRGTPNMSRNEFRKQKRQNRKQCISSCIQSFGKYYDVASSLSPYSTWGVGIYAATSIYQGVGEDAIVRRGIRNQNYGNYRWGQRLISGVNLFARLNIASTIASLTGLGAQVSMQAYCRLSECRKK